METDDLESMDPLCHTQVIAEDISGNNGYVELSFQARKLDDKVRLGSTACWALSPLQTGWW